MSDRNTDGSAKLLVGINKKRSKFLSGRRCLWSCICKTAISKRTVHVFLLKNQSAVINQVELGPAADRFQNSQTTVRNRML